MLSTGTCGRQQRKCVWQLFQQHAGRSIGSPHGGVLSVPRTGNDLKVPTSLHAGSVELVARNGCKHKRRLSVVLHWYQAMLPLQESLSETMFIAAVVEPHHTQSVCNLSLVWWR